MNRLIVMILACVAFFSCAPVDRDFDARPEPVVAPVAPVVVEVPLAKRVQECQSAFDCAVAPSDCLAPACLAGMCAFVPKADGVACTTNGDGDGSCIGGACEANILATCDVTTNCWEQTPACTCPGGLICSLLSGRCVVSDNPYDECNSNTDCVNATPDATGTCWVQNCYNPVGPGSGCGWLTKSGGQPCKKPSGGNGVCALPPNDGDCI
jgi:hypothetical protein